MEIRRLGYFPPLLPPFLPVEVWAVMRSSKEWFSKQVPRPAASAAPGNLLQMQIRESHPRISCFDACFSVAELPVPAPPLWLHLSQAPFSCLTPWAGRGEPRLLLLGPHPCPPFREDSLHSVVFSELFLGCLTDPDGREVTSYSFRQGTPSLGYPLPSGLPRSLPAIEIS